jgi:hypothetical protein
MKTVHATQITETTFRYPCCCKRGFHIHGSNGDLSNREEYRSSHCHSAVHKYDGPVCIVIDDDTERVLKRVKKKSQSK